MIHTEVVMGLTDTVRLVLDHKGIGVCAVGPGCRFTKPWKSWRIKISALGLVRWKVPIIAGVFSERDYPRKGNSTGQGVL